MTLIIHDINKQQFAELFNISEKDTKVIYDNGSIKNCVGCFGCWIKTPGKCIIKDGYENIGKDFSQAERVIVISKCCYGCYSPFIKNVLDRSIPYLLPSFEVTDHLTHHKQRYLNTFHFSLYFYGDDITDAEKATASRLVKANSLNYHSKSYRVSFFRTLNELSKEADF